MGNTPSRGATPANKTIGAPAVVSRPAAVVPPAPVVAVAPTIPIVPAKPAWAYTYLFEEIVAYNKREAEKADESSKAATAGYYERTFKETTAQLQSQYKLTHGSNDEKAAWLEEAKGIAMRMGTQFKPKDDDLKSTASTSTSAESSASAAAESAVKKVGDWAGDYVDNWRQVSGNAPTVRDMVIAELENAYELKIDVRRKEVIGKMFTLATSTWSTFGSYAGPSDSQFVRR
ncbi:hypothetical protein [Dyella mobilis]|uniref:Uncharacterized protein n=1 Tax=Dyella mobilis TaxID=1849582 RepID=A0ABS2KM84_9GAMM|nr:hypothetical protein [Dyella mobilis]MBM7132277.1 hypothetical protein [Dyella mobilis]GLQ95738.1 hypothetical protein GCM10007863_01560 [Dyella mobilis]